MSSSFSTTSGSVRLPNTPDSRTLVEGLEAELKKMRAPELEVHEIEEGEALRVSIYYGGFVNTDPMDDLIKATLAPRVLEAAHFETEYDGERGGFWLGSDEQVKSGASLAAVEAIRAASKDLLAEHRELALAATQGANA